MQNMHWTARGPYQAVRLVEEVALAVHNDAALGEEAQHCRQTKHTVQVEEEAASSKVCGVETPSREAGSNSNLMLPPQPI